jgi:hypothetical protein
MDLPINANAILHYKIPAVGEKLLDPSSRMVRKEQKGEALLMELIGRYSAVGDVVVDLFSGTGSSLVAAAVMDRVAVGCERDSSCWRRAVSHVADRVRWHLNSAERRRYAVEGTTEMKEETVRALSSCSRFQGKANPLAFAKVRMLADYYSVS